MNHSSHQVCTVTNPGLEKSLNSSSFRILLAQGHGLLVLANDLAGVSISFCISGYLRVTGGYICRRRAFDPRGVRGHAPPENFEVLDSRRCIFRSFFVALFLHFFVPKSTNLNKFEENYVTMK